MTDLAQKKEGEDHGSKKSPATPSNLIFSGHYRVSIMVALISIGFIVLFGFIGFQLDILLGSKPILMLLGLVISFPVSQIVLYKWIVTKYIPQKK